MDREKILAEIDKIRQEIISTPYHKGTEHHIGRLRAKIARLEDKLQEGKKGGHGGGGGYALPKSGDATAVLVGFPSVGKSTLLNALTQAESRVGDYPFTTLEVIPGMMTYRGAKIQMLDVPGLIVGAAAGRGRGKEVLSVIRVADLVILTAEAAHPEQKEAIAQELMTAGVRLDKKKPPLIIQKKDRGGIIIKNDSFLTGFSLAEALGIAQEILRNKNAEIILSGKVDRGSFLDALLGNCVYVPTLTVFTKADLLSPKEKERLFEKYSPALLVSSEKKEGLRELKEAIFKKLSLMRVFLKPKTGEPDLNDPLVIKKGTKIRKSGNSH